MTNRSPSFQFYTGDWRKDPAVQSLDHEHKGIWIELLCIMWDSVERGRLVLPDGSPMPDCAIARNLGIPEADWKQTRSTLLSYGVASEDECLVLYNRRMVRDEEARLKKVEAGRKGGKTSKTPTSPPSKTEPNGGSSSSSSTSTSTSVKEKPPYRGAKRKRPLPDDWGPSETHATKASELGLDVESEAERFRLHAQANGRTQLDWDASFRLWLSKAVDFGGSAGARASQPNPNNTLPHSPSQTAHLEAMRANAGR